MSWTHLTRFGAFAAVLGMGVSTPPACAVPLSPEPDATVVRLADQAAPPATDGKTAFMWTPGGGFVPVDQPADRQGTLLGIAATDLPGGTLEWHPEAGLIPASGQTDGNAGTMASSWTSEGNSFRPVVWSGEKLPVLSDVMRPPNDVAVTAVIDVAQNGTVLGRARLDDASETSFFIWGGRAHSP